MLSIFVVARRWIVACFQSLRVRFKSPESEQWTSRRRTYGKKEEETRSDRVGDNDDVINAMSALTPTFRREIAVDVLVHGVDAPHEDTSSRPESEYAYQWGRGCGDATAVYSYFVNSVSAVTP